MFFTASKILHFLTTPIVWVFILLLIGYFWSKRNVIRTGLIVLFLFSNSFLCNEIYGLYETQINEDVIAYPFDIGIVLGGFSEYNSVKDRIEFNEASDRLNHAIRLYKQKKSRKYYSLAAVGVCLKTTEKHPI